ADSLPAYDVWKATQFSPAQLMNSAISGPDADPDGDGYNNQAEFTAGTNPLDGASKLKLNLTPTPTNALLNFEGISNKAYTVQFCDALGVGLWQRYADVGALPSNTTVVLALLPTNLAGFFRLITPQLP
ncbi:MAG TPA: thrombospondin type 3 repeat-containing protein, partial [Verrucomicrobiae bacterium]|nr:thrombospondin type 3 repeat-containing protein [Verrucomicrobiae bacterium]